MANTQEIADFLNATADPKYIRAFHPFHLKKLQQQKFGLNRKELRKVERNYEKKFGPLNQRDRQVFENTIIAEHGHDSVLPSPHSPYTNRDALNFVCSEIGSLCTRVNIGIKLGQLLEELTARLSEEEQAKEPSLNSDLASFNTEEEVDGTELILRNIRLLHERICDGNPKENDHVLLADNLVELKNRYQESISGVGRKALAESAELADIPLPDLEQSPKVKLHLDFIDDLVDRCLGHQRQR